MVAINLTMRYLAWDLETNLLIFQCSFIFVIPVCPDPAASCEVTKQNKEDLSVEMTKNVCRDDVHQENAHDCAPVFQGLLSVSFLHSALLKLMRTLLRSFPSGTQAPRNTESTTTPPTPKSLPTVGWIRVAPCQRVDSQQLLTQYFVQSWRSFALITTQAPKLFAYLDDWYLWIKPQFLLQTIAVITATTRSVKLALQSTKNTSMERLLPRPHST